VFDIDQVNVIRVMVDDKDPLGIERKVTRVISCRIRSVDLQLADF
jgi:hypothetical protein